MKIKNILTVLAVTAVATACFKLDKDPEGVLSTNQPFRSTGEIQNYVNQFYETGVRTQDFAMGGGAHIAGSDTYSDNMAASAPVARINGALSIGNAQSLTGYTRIRNVNDEPLILETSFYPCALYPNLTRELLQTHSFYSLLYDVGVIPANAVDSYEAVIKSITKDSDDGSVPLLGY